MAKAEKNEAPWPEITQGERRSHEILFYSQGPLDGYLIGERARDLFLHSGLRLTVLSQIWNLADVSNDNLLNVDEFVLAVHLIQGILQGRPIPKALPDNLTPSTSSLIPLPQMLECEKEAYAKIFQSYDSDRKGSINCVDARELLQASKLSVEQLADIWDISDVDRDGSLGVDEWTVACQLVRLLKKGQSLDGSVNPFTYLSDRISPTSLHARKNRVDQYEKHKLRLMSLKEKRKNQALRENRRLDLLKEKSTLEKDLYSKLKSLGKCSLSEEEFNKIVSQDADDIERLEEIVARLKKEHEKVRQETVKVILGEQKLQVEVQGIKKETDELSKRLGTTHTKATKDPDPFHQLYEQLKEERKKSNLSEGEEPEIHLPFKISPFDKDALKPVSGSDVFINPHVIDNNNTKNLEDNSAIIENLHEFEDKLIETWSSPKARRSSTSGETMETITKDAEEDRDEIFMIVKDRDNWLSWSDEKSTETDDPALKELQRKLIELKTEMQKLNSDVGGRMVFRNQSDYLARKKAKEEEEQQEKNKYPRRSKSSADPDYAAKRRSYVLEKRRDDLDYREKRLNRRSLNIDSAVNADREKTKSKAPDRPSRPPSLRTSDILSETVQERPRRGRLSNQEVKSEEISPNKSTTPVSSPRKSVSPTTSPTRSTKKTRAPEPPVSPTSNQTVSPLKESKIPVLTEVKDTKTVPERPPRRKKKSSSDSEPNSPRPSSITEISEAKTTSNETSVTDEKSEESSNTVTNKGTNLNSDIVTVKTLNPDSEQKDISVVVAPKPDEIINVTNPLIQPVQNGDVESYTAEKVQVNCDIKPRSEEKIETETSDEVIVPVNRKLEKSLPTFEKFDKISPGKEEKLVNAHFKEKVSTKEIEHIDNLVTRSQVNFLVESHDIELEEPVIVKPVDIKDRKVNHDQNIVTNGDIDIEVTQSLTKSKVSISENNRGVDFDSNSNGIDDSLIKEEKDDISLLESIVQTLDFPENKSNHLLADKISLTPSLGSDTQSEADSLPPLPDSEPPTLPLGAPPMIESEQVVEEEVIAVISSKPIETSLLSSNIFKSEPPVPDSSSPKRNTVSNFRSNHKFGDLKMSEATTVEEVVVPNVNGLDLCMNDFKLDAKFKQETTETEEEDSDLSDIEGQNREFEATFTPGEHGTGSLPTNATDDDGDGGIELISFNTTSTSIQSPGESQTDSAFEDMMSSMHSNDADGANQVTLSNTLDDFQDSLVTESFESVKSSTEESELQTISPPETPRMSYSYVAEKRPMSPPDPSKTPRDTTSIVKKAQQFSESLNKPPKVTIRASSEEMSEQRLQELDAERRAVINISKTRNVVMEMSESDEVIEMEECLITETTPSSGSIEVTKSTTWEDNSEEYTTPVKFTGKKINLEDKPEKVDLYGNNIIQENDTTESVDRESIANLASTRKQWENLLQASPKDTTQKNTPKKISPVKHWEVKLPYKPVTSPESETVPRSPSPEPRKMEEVTSSNNYENESAIEREIRLANEREQMLRREQEERTELLKRQNASKQQLNVEKFESNNNNSNEFKTMYHEMTEADRGSEMQIRETIIQQELNEQRERERAITHKSAKTEDADMPESTESLIAKEIRLQQEREKEISKRYQPAEEEGTEEEINNTEQTNGAELNYEEAIASNQHEGESLIARELRETREREEELRQQRERFSKTDISKEPEQVKAPVQETPQKTVQSPPVQSVQSSRNFSTPPQSSSHVARNVKVAPISDSYEVEEEERPQPVKKAETPIEREIRLARERENELRQLKGLPLLEAPKEPVQEPVTPKSSEQESHVYHKRPNPQSNSMKQYASSKLQKELLKQKERENAYRQEGRIITTSEDHIDPVKYTDIAQINNNVPVKRNFVTRKSITSLSDGEKTPSENGDIESSKTVTLTPTTPQSSSKEPKFGRRSMPSSGGAVFSYKESSNKAESKIERELREMREREEELRQSRVGSGVASPNNPDSPREISQNSHMSLAAQWEQKYSK